MSYRLPVCYAELFRPVRDDLTGQRLFYADGGVQEYTGMLPPEKIGGPKPVITDASFREAEGKVDLDVLPPDPEPPAEEAPKEDAPEEDSDKGSSEDADAVPAEGEEEPPKPFDIEALAIAYDDPGDMPEFKFLPERDRDVARALIEKVRGKDKESTVKALKEFSEKIKPAQEFHQKFGDWAYPMEIIASDENLQAEVAKFIEAKLKGETYAPEVPKADGPKAAEPTSAPVAAPAPPMDLSKLEIKFTEEDSKVLEELGKEVQVDEKVAKYLNEFNQRLTKAAVSAMGQNITAQVNAQLGTLMNQINKKLAPVMEAIEDTRKVVLDRAIQEQESDLIRTHGETARRLLRRGPDGRNAVDHERAEAAKSGEVLTIRSAFNNLLASESAKKGSNGALSGGKAGLTALKGGGKAGAAAAKSAAPASPDGQFPSGIRNAAQMKEYLAKLSR